MCLFSSRYSVLKSPLGPPQDRRDQHPLLPVLIPAEKPPSRPASCPSGLHCASPRMTDSGFSSPPCPRGSRRSPHFSRPVPFLKGFSFPSAAHLLPGPLAVLASPLPPGPAWALLTSRQLWRLPRARGALSSPAGPPATLEKQCGQWEGTPRRK